MQRRMLELYQRADGAEASLRAAQALQEAVAAFPGAVLLVSREARFYRPWADRVISVETLQ